MVEQKIEHLAEFSPFRHADEPEDGHEDEHADE